MNQHLFVDALRRIRYGLLAVGALAAVLWLLTGTGASGAAFGIAFSMSLAVISGPFAGSRSVAPKEALLLPLSRQEIWRTQWWIGTVVTAGVMTTGKIAGMLLGRSLTQQALPIEVVWLSSLLDLACIGIVTSLLPAVQMLQSIRVTGSGPWKSVVAAGPVIALLVFAFSPFLAIASFKYVPTGWSHLPALALGFMLIGAGLAAASYFMTPRVISRPSSEATRAALRTRGKSRWPAFSNVTGLRRMIGQAWLGGALTQAGSIVMVPTRTCLINA